MKLPDDRESEALNALKQHTGIPDDRPGAFTRSRAKPLADETIGAIRAAGAPGRKIG